MRKIYAACTLKVVLSQLVMFLTVFFHWMYKMKYSCYRECSLIHGWFVYCFFYATPKVTKYQRCNFIIQIHQSTIKIDKININLLFECVKIVEFNFNSHVFHITYQEKRFLNQDACFLNQEGRRQFLISFVSEGD